VGEVERRSIHFGERSVGLSLARMQIGNTACVGKPSPSHGEKRG